jgi:polysaccharide pyruvyl transferase WcaK-like protein
VLALLRRARLVIAMRFHAAIFALSQEVSCVGVDYQFGRVGKVGELFDERGAGASVVAADGFTEERLLDAIHRLEFTP